MFSIAKFINPHGNQNVWNIYVLKPKIKDNSASKSKIDTEIHITQYLKKVCKNFSVTVNDYN